MSKREHWKYQGVVEFAGRPCYLWTHKRRGRRKEKWHISVSYYRMKLLGGFK